ncbi:DNA repair protein RecN [Mangrovimonas sp. AS39]|uniref:DNA repair protein RecN n=1 Tax=Mangrovimonas futianensis TaxID=2895523 RepID=UPI001E324996|nr:DNA repair protein RecN [Mangrovimonas futianensis]MCF1192637.1 DNA repair protein RecN [Mangrovimonas futianensis]MCF1196442.1 DNA repair protein RecN [Mangrovimonas futianensis]
MLTSLAIKNYALIDHLQVQFNQGLTIITGETGAGKSILLGGLSLILGKRADLSSLKDSEKKCIIEAVFDVKHYDLADLFKEEDLDYEPQTIIRREILPSGKSRAFVNDSPVNLSSLQALSKRLIDIHSQHETLQITEDDFQFQIIDALAVNGSRVSAYKDLLREFRSLQSNLDRLLKQKAEAIKEYDYHAFLLNELEEAKLDSEDLEALEEEYEMLNNVEEIQEKLAHSVSLLSEEEIGVLKSLTELKNQFQGLSGFGSKYQDLYGRINSALIELDDVFSEVENLKDGVETDPNRLEFVNGRLQVINNLFTKHLVNSIPELLIIKQELGEKVSKTENLDEEISELENKILLKEKVLNQAAKEIHENRQKVIPSLIQQLKDILSQLGMPNAQFKIELQLVNQFLQNGKDQIAFLFVANKGGNFNELKKAASGGELSRIMLAVKAILSNYVQLPTIMFDEIDTGVSGEISHKMGQIMLDMSKNMQVFAITHLPQIAAKGHSHFKVYKEDKEDVTETNLVKLNHDERIIEIAQMLGGVEISNSAIAHAKQLLN